MTPIKPRVLLVDDEAAIRRFLVPFLQAQGMLVVEAASATEGLSLAGSHNPDVILLDLGLPDLDGQELLERLPPELRERTIVVSVRDGDRDKVAALDAGAGDYLTKPLSTAELAARVRAVLRRRNVHPPVSEGPLIFGDLHIDLAGRTVRRSGALIHLTPIEYTILNMLVQNAGKVVTHGHMQREVWGRRTNVQESSLRIHVHNLRHKIEPDPTRPRFLKTEAGVGHRFVNPDE